MRRRGNPTIALMKDKIKQRRPAWNGHVRITNGVNKVLQGVDKEKYDRGKWTFENLELKQ